MVKYRNHWVCIVCAHGDPRSPELSGGHKIKVLNLYAGIGGNRWLWPSSLDITSVELNPLVAAEYRSNFPGDTLIVGDAHAFLVKNFKKFDIIWTSRPCQTHSKMNHIFENKRYVDMGLYQEIILLKEFFAGKYVCENVTPYYEPLIKPDFKIERHCFWTNVPQLTDMTLPGFESENKGRGQGLMKMSKEAICKWLGVSPGKRNIYLSGKSQVQIYRNCVHPLLGQSIMNDILNSMTCRSADGI